MHALLKTSALVLALAGLGVVCEMRPATAAATVTIYRNSYGVPSIVAGNYADGAYGLGYAMAQDDAVVAERNFRRARGTLSEIDGSNQILGDSTVRALGLEESAQAAAKKLQGEESAICANFCSGFNKSVVEQKESLPPWIAPITPVDVLAFGEFLNCMEPLFESAVYRSPLGSNEFAVASKRTNGDHAILMMNPHLYWAPPFLWYEFAVYTPGIQFAGVTQAGMPLGIMGHTDKVAWAMTDDDPRYFAFYRVTTDAQHPHQYNYQGHWTQFTSKTFQIGVLSDGTIAKMPVTVQMTKWGPMLGSDSVAGKLEYPDPIDTAREAMGFLRARSANEFRSALGREGLAMWNIVYADTAGNIGYQYNARVRRRDPLFDWSQPVAGDDPRTAWGSLLSLDELPHVNNPTSGLLVNCNTAPWLVSPDSHMSRSWPSYVTSYGDNTRYDRLMSLLQNAPAKLSMLDAWKIAADTQAPNALQTVAALRQAAARSTTGLDVGPALAVLEAWDGRADIDSKGTALFYYWLNAGADGGRLAWQAAANKAWSAADNTTGLSMLVAAADRLKKDHGAIDVPWGDIHQATRGSLTYPVQGFSFDAAGLSAVDPNNGSFADGTISCTRGSSFRMLVDLDPAGVKSWSILPFGESQNPSSPHYADQAILFGQGGYKRTEFGKSNAIKDAVQTTTLTVTNQPD